MATLEFGQATEDQAPSTTPTLLLAPQASGPAAAKAIAAADASGIVTPPFQRIKSECIRGNLVILGVDLAAQCAQNAHVRVRNAAASTRFC